MAEEKEKPLTSKDVRKRIEENDGTAKGLDLSGKTFEQGIDLSGLELNEIILEGANLEGANFEKATLAGANLQRANLSFANLQGVRCGGINLRKALLVGADFRGAVLSGANMEEALFPSIKFSRDTEFINVNWGEKSVTIHTVPEGIMHGVTERTYRELKNWHNEAGMYDIAGQFFCWEMEAKRKVFWWGAGVSRPLTEVFHPFKPKEVLRALLPRKPLPWVRLMLYGLLCGYGERPWRVVAWGILVLFGSALLYFFLRGVAPYTLSVEAFSTSLYYSAVSFTALGYGPWFSASSVRSWVQGVGAVEAIIGVFMIALFLVTFTRKMTR